MEAQKWLNAYVRFVAFLERVGNALGTLAFIWATVVVLGGFITNLTRKDFGFATAIVFLEAFRAFSRQSMPDDQLLFKTTGGIKLKRVSLRGGSLYYVNAAIMTLCMCLIPGGIVFAKGFHLVPSALAWTPGCTGLCCRAGAFSNTENTHVLAALRVLYIMVLLQGILYMTACILESCSTLLRRSVALGCGLVDTLGWESVNLYYQHAYDKFLQESVFDATEINLSTFAVQSLSCDVSRDKKLAALGILHSFLRQEAHHDSKMKLISEITTSTKAVTALISMLGWTVPEVAETRLLAAKVTAHLAPYLQVVQIPGSMQMVSTLLDEETQQAQIMDTDAAGNHGVSTSSTAQIIDIEEEDYDSSTREWDASMISQIRRIWKHLNILRSIPHDGPKGADDSLPALGMLILQGLAHNPDNCNEISIAIPKIIGSMTPNQKQIVTTASLTLVAKLAVVKGKVGIVIRQELCENPFLLSCLASTMEDRSSSLEQLKPAMDIIAKLAVDRKTRQDIGRIQVIMHKLVQEFLGRDESLKTLRTASGEALAMLAMESVDNCCAILVKYEPEYKLMDSLQAMLQLDECPYTAASLLQSLCANCGHQLRDRGQSNNLSSTLEVVLEKIMDARGKQMEALVGLDSEICKFLSKRITPAPDPLGSCPNYVKAFVQKLVGELKAHKKPSPEFPSMRRSLVELTICMAESWPGYADTFKKHGMVDALSEVENTPSKVESYRVFFGSVGVVSQRGSPLSVLVTRAKELVGGTTPHHHAHRYPVC